MKIEQSSPSMREPEKWNLRKLPPAKHPDVGPFFQRLFEDALRERSRLNLEDRWRQNYRLYRGNHHQDTLGVLTGKSRGKLSLALLGANINRTVANLTARPPQAEVQSVDGDTGEVERLLTVKMAEWNSVEEQQHLLSKSALNMEIYGVTIEKAVYDSAKETAKTVVLDPYSFLPAPGYYEQLNDAPYLVHMYPMDVHEAQDIFDSKEVVESSEMGVLLGEEREDDWIHHGTTQGSGNYPGNYVNVNHPDELAVRNSNRVLVVECWIRDYSKQKVDQPVVDEMTGEPVVDEMGMVATEKVEMPKYPGFIRKVTFCNNGNVVLDDSINPNINPALPMDAVMATHLFDHFPFFHANSYSDSTSLWGFSQAELCGDINLAIDDIWSQIMAYLKMALFPPLILPKDTKIPLSKIRYLPRLVLQPMSKGTGDGIKWLDLPTPPTWLFQALDTLIKFFDRVSQIEDVDRGAADGGVIAASAIQIMQERASVLIRAKIRAIDYLVRMRGRAYLSFYQNFGDKPEPVKVGEEVEMVRGVDFAGHHLNYVVESGSTVARTNAQIQEQALQLFQLQAIDRRALLSAINFPNWKEVLERMAEGEVGMALSVLVEAGLPPQDAMAIQEFVMQAQGAPGDLTLAGGGGVGAQVSGGQRPPGQGAPGQMTTHDVTAKPGAPAVPGKPKASQGGAK